MLIVVGFDSSFDKNLLSHDELFLPLRRNDLENNIFENDRMPSERAFGWTFAVLFAILSAYLFYIGVHYSTTVIVSLALLFLTICKPSTLSLPNLMWFRFGKLLQILVSPILLGLIFFGIFLPLKIIIKILGKKLLNTTIDPNADTYWEPKKIDGKSDIREQF